MKSFRVFLVGVHRPHGMSLIEAVLVVGLTGFVLSLLTSLFVMSSRFTTSAEARTEQQSERLKALQTVRRAISESPAAGLTFHHPSGVVGQGDLALSALTCRENGRGEPFFQESDLAPLYQGYQIVFWSPEERALMWRFRALSGGPTTAVEPLSEADLAASLQSEGGLRLLEEVIGFELFDPSSGEARTGWANPLGLRLRQEGPAGAPAATSVLVKSLRP